MSTLDLQSRISVVIPLFNGAAFIKRTLESVLAQTVAARQIIVVDDGSDDESPAIAEGFPQVTLLRQAHAGPGAARNLGSEHSAGEWVAFLDADDLWFPDHLAEVLRLIHSVPEAGLVATAHRKVLNNTVTAGLPAGNHRGSTRVRIIDYHRLAARDIGVVCSSSAAAKRNAILDVGGFATLPRAEDIDLWARMALRYPVAVSPRVTALYVRGTGGLMERAAEARTRGERPSEAHESDEPTPLHLRSMESALASGEHDHRRKSLELYLDGHTTARWKLVLLEADQRAARSRWRTLRHRRHPHAWRYFVAAFVPLPIGAALSRLLRAGRRLRAA